MATILKTLLIFHFCQQIGGWKNIIFPFFRLYYILQTNFLFLVRRSICIKCQFTILLRWKSFNFRIFCISFMCLYYSSDQLNHESYIWFGLFFWLQFSGQRVILHVFLFVLFYVRKCNLVIFHFFFSIFLCFFCFCAFIFCVW